MAILSFGSPYRYLSKPISTIIAVQMEKQNVDSKMILLKAESLNSQAP